MKEHRFTELAIFTALCASAATFMLSLFGMRWVAVWRLFDGSDNAIDIPFHYLTIAWWSVIVLFGVATRSRNMPVTAVVTGLVMVVIPTVAQIAAA